MNKKPLTAVDIQVVRTFAENNMKYFTTAKKLFFNDNTIRYHLEQVRKKTGLDPTEFFDLVELLRRLDEEPVYNFKAYE